MKVQTAGPLQKSQIQRGDDTAAIVGVGVWDSAGLAALRAAYRPFLTPSEA